MATEPRISRRRFVRLAALLGTGGAIATPALGGTLRTAKHRVRQAKHFVLIHGAWHGAWCWYKIAPALQAAGHQVTALDLPSAGTDKTPPAGVTLRTQADRVIALLDGTPEPVVLVGHSAGGAVISTVADAVPDKVERLVYVTAFLLQRGDSVSAAGLRDRASGLARALVLRPDGTIDVARSARRTLFYGDCTERDVTLADALLTPIGARSALDPVVVGERFSRVRRFYVSCLRDRALSPALQRTMYEALPCEKVFAIRSDHSPFLSHPAALVRTLLRIARA